MTNIFLAVTVVCSNSFIPNIPDTACQAISTIFPTSESCEGANTAVRATLHEVNKKKALDSQVYLAFMDCVELERPNLDQGG